MIIQFKNGVRKELFKKITGRPKEGDVIECINPVIVLPIGMISICSMFMATKSQNIFLGLFSLAFAWQIGWGMSIERFKNSERNNKEDK